MGKAENDGGQKRLSSSQQLTNATERPVTRTLLKIKTRQSEKISPTTSQKKTIWILTLNLRIKSELECIFPHVALILVHRTARVRLKNTTKERPQHREPHSWSSYTKGEIYALLGVAMCFIFTGEKTKRMRTNIWIHTRCFGFSLKCFTCVSFVVFSESKKKKGGCLIFRPMQYLYKPAHLLRHHPLNSERWHFFL